MTSRTRVPPAQITGFKGALMKRMATRMMGQVPTPLGVFWHNPEVLQVSFAIGNKAKKWDRCDESLKSFAHMAVAALLGCTWCLDFHYFQAHNEHLDLEKAREVPRWRESEVFTPLERDVMAYAEAMSQTPPAVTDELSARLLEQLGAAALVEGMDRVATALSGLRRVVPDAVSATMWLNGAPAVRVDHAGTLDTAVSLVIENGRVSRIYAIRNPRKLARLDEPAPLSRG